MKSEQDIKCQIENLKICLKTLEEKQKRLAKREQKWQKDVVEWREIHKNHPGMSCKIGPKITLARQGYVCLKFIPIFCKNKFQIIGSLICNSGSEYHSNHPEEKEYHKLQARILNRKEYLSKKVKLILKLLINTLRSV